MSRIELLDPLDKTALSHVTGRDGNFDLKVLNEGPHQLKIIAPKAEPKLVTQLVASTSFEETIFRPLFSAITSLC